jgi:hypothetical protein
MNRILLLVAAAAAAPLPAIHAAGDPFDASILSLKISAYPYDHYRPWKRSSLRERAAYACAVGEREAITTAAAVADATVIQARRLGRNEFVPARVKVVDYDSNLCLLELDAEALGPPLVPLAFSDAYRQEARVAFHWLSAGGRVETARGELEEPRVEQTVLSHTRLLSYVVSNVSAAVRAGELCSLDGAPVGIAARWDDRADQARVVPAPIISHFLADAADGDYKGFPAVGFAPEKLLDSTLRAFLKMPSDMADGIYLAEVFTVGTGSDVLRPADVLLSIDGVAIDAHGRFEHPVYKKTSFRHLIASKRAGEALRLSVWRGGARQELTPAARPIPASAMLVPHYEYDRQPAYVIAGGFLLQKLTRSYLTAWGSDWEGKVSAELNRYATDEAFKPTAERREIVILSYVIPAAINVGYQGLKQLVVTRINGKAIGSMTDVVAARKLDPGAPFDVIEFENANPTVVIPRAQLAATNMALGMQYGIRKLVNVP